MLKVSTLLGLMLISLTATADNQSYQFSTDYKQKMRKLNEQIDSDKAASRANPMAYYTDKLTKCVESGKFDFNLYTALGSKKPEPFTLKSCSGIFTQALSRGDLNETQIKMIIDQIAEQEREIETIRAQNAARHQAIKAQADELAKYGDQKLNLPSGK